MHTPVKRNIGNTLCKDMGNTFLNNAAIWSIEKSVVIQVYFTYAEIAIDYVQEVIILTICLYSQIVFSSADEYLSPVPSQKAFFIQPLYYQSLVKWFNCWVVFTSISFKYLCRAFVIQSLVRKYTIQTRSLSPSTPCQPRLPFFHSFTLSKNPLRCCHFRLLPFFHPSNASLILPYQFISFCPKHRPKKFLKSF